MNVPHTYIIIPGFGETGKEKEYSKIKMDLIKKNRNVIIYTPKWSYSIISNNFLDLQNFIRRKNLKKVSMIGFSFGAMLAYLYSQKYPNNTHYIHLCSLSPYFKEVLSKIPSEAFTFFGRRRAYDFKNLSLYPLPKNKAYFYIGDSDWKVAKELSKELSKALKSNLEIISDTGHYLSDSYLKKITDKLN